MEIRVGAQFGHFILREKIGGAMASVWRATDVHSGTQHALKISAPSQSEQNRLLHEAALHQRVHSNHVVQFLDCGEAQGRAFVATEWIDGVKLNTIVPKNVGLHASVVLPIVRQLCRAAEAIHAAKVLHLDLKPGNILLAPTNDLHIVKVIDFGIAVLIGEKFDVAHGSAGYVAPEIIDGSANASVRSDVYSIGCVLAFLLTGAAPFKGKNDDATLAAQLEGEIAALSHERLKDADALRSVVEKALSIKPSQRFSSPKDLELALVYALSS